VCGQGAILLRTAPLKALRQLPDWYPPPPPSPRFWQGQGEDNVFQMSCYPFDVRQNVGKLKFVLKYLVSHLSIKACHR
jgi:hypothetical protein